MIATATHEMYPVRYARNGDVSIAYQVVGEGPVLDAAGSTRSALLGVSQGGPSAIAFAAAEPERTSALVRYGTYARVSRDEDYPYGPPAEGLLQFADAAAAKWGGPEGAGLFAPSAAEDPEFRLWWARATRAAASPRSAWVNLCHRAELDVRDRLARVRAGPGAAPGRGPGESGRQWPLPCPPAASVPLHRTRR